MPANVNKDPVGTPQTVFGRRNRSQLERQAGDIAPSLKFDTKEQTAAAEDRFKNAFSGVARSAALEGSGLSTGFSGRNIRSAGTLGAGLAAEKGQIERQAGAENRANFQTLLGAQGQEDQRRLAESQQTGKLQGESFSQNQLFGALSLDPEEGFSQQNRERIAEAGFKFDEATGQFTRESETLASKAQATQEELQRGQLTGNLEGKDGAERTLAGQQQDVQALQAQNSIELAERQRQDAREIQLQQLGIDASKINEQMRQFDATILQQATEFAEQHGLSEDQFLESKHQFDTGAKLQNAQLQAQMDQFNASIQLQSAELFGSSDGLARAEVEASVGSKAGEAGYRRDLDFDKDGEVSGADLDIFDELSGGSETNPQPLAGVSTLAQRQAQFQEARSASEISLQSQALGIEESKLRNAMQQSQAQLDETSRQFNSAFSGYLFEEGPDGQIVVLDPATDQPVQSAEHQLAMQNLTRVKASMESTVQQLAVNAGLLGPGEPIKSLTDEQSIALMSMVMADRAPTSPNVSFGGSVPQGGQGGGFMSNLMQLGGTLGTLALL